MNKKVQEEFEAMFVTPDLLRPLRHKVLRNGMPYESTKYDGDEEASAYHVAVSNLEGAIIAVGTMLVRRFDDRPELFAYQLRGMAVDESYRGSGAGRLALKVLETKARELEAAIIWCKARTPAAGFYERCGWKVVSNEFEIPDFGPHYLMIKELVE